MRASETQSFKIHKEKTKEFDYDYDYECLYI